MSTVLHLGVRNVFRHPRRTGMTAGAVALGVVFMTVAAGFLDFTFAGLRDSLVYGGLGHLQLLPAEPREVGTRLEPAVAADARRRLLAEPGVEHVGARLELQGLVSAGPHTVTFSGTGVEPAVEATVRALTTIRAGEWFTGRERMPRVLLGAGLAARLRVGPRDVASVITYSESGSLTAADVQVAGVFESGVIEYDERALLMPLALAQELLATTALSSIVVTVRDPAGLDALAPALGRVLPDGARDARLVRWDELSPVYGSVVAL
jgi:putative ABC transport system permease protein